MDEKERIREEIENLEDKLQDCTDSGICNVIVHRIAELRKELEKL